MAAFDDVSAQTVAGFAAPGALEKTYTLPFGEMPGFAFMGLATTDTFVHGWDLAKATGQSTDLAPELAAALLEQSKAADPGLVPRPRGCAVRTRDRGAGRREQRRSLGCLPRSYRLTLVGRHPPRDFVPAGRGTWTLSDRDRCCQARRAARPLEGERHAA